MISLRFRRFSLDDWTSLRIQGDDEAFVLSAIAGRLPDVEIWTGEEWEAVEDAEAPIDVDEEEE